MIRTTLTLAALLVALPSFACETSIALITVTRGGQVSHSRGYATQRMCEQAKSLALHGQTIEQREASDAAWRKRNKAALDRGETIQDGPYYVNDDDIKHAECVAELPALKPKPAKAEDTRACLTATYPDGRVVRFSDPFCEGSRP